MEKGGKMSDESATNDEGYGMFDDIHGASGRQMTAYVGDFLGEHAVGYDIESLTDAFRDALNAHLAETGISIHGEHVMGPYPVREDSGELLAGALESVDLGELADRFEK